MKTDWKPGDRFRWRYRGTGERSRGTDAWEAMICEVVELSSGYSKRSNDPAYRVVAVEPDYLYESDKDVIEDWADLGIGLVYASEMEEL